MSKFDPYEHYNLIRHPDGTLTRRNVIATSEPNPDENSGEPVVSKDITLNQVKKTWVRIYRPTKIPSNDGAIVKLPIVLYFHGGDWIRFTARDTITHHFCNGLAVTLTAIVVSVDYRLAPESRLPAQYDDAVDAIQWVSKQASDMTGGEPWLRNYGDYSRCYLYGGGNGANIVFFSALRVVDMNVEPLRISGIILNQPMFGGINRTASELRYATDQLMPLPVLDLGWELVLPIGTDRDHRYCNPLVDGTHKEKLSSLPRCLVIGFGMDPLVDRQQDFVTMLVMAGVPLMARFDDVGFHGIDLVDARRTDAVVGLVKEFIH